MPSQPDLYALPISARPPISWKQTFKSIFVIILIDLGCLLINAWQLLLLLPVRLVPFRFARRCYDKGICWTKGCFGCLLVLIMQWFAPTSLRITFETQGQGRFSKKEIERIVKKNAKGEVVALDLPTKLVIIGNHQIYADWWYVWCFLYYVGPTGLHRHIFITLKKSLQWVPVVGWAMQFFNFIFLARSWASDKLHLASQLAALGKQVKKQNTPFCYLLYPEGTLVSKQTRPISRKFADKMGIPDMKNILLPRSTGLHYSLRSLSPRIPELKLLDMTVVYPGVPPMGYGQSYYTLRSILFNGVPPPAVHIHLRLFDVKGDIPIGDMSESVSNDIPDVAGKNAVEVDIPEKEKEKFDVWLRNLWSDKDEAISKYYETGTLETSPGDSVVEIPLKLRRRREILEAFGFFLPAGIWYLVCRKGE